MAIGLVFGSLTAIIILADGLSRSGDFAAVSVALLGQVYVLPLLFGALSQAMSYRRSRLGFGATKIADNMQHNEHSQGGHVLDKASHFKLAHSATLHCLIGCGIGEVIGVIIGTALGLSNLITLVLAVVLGFVFGFIFGMWPLLRARFEFSRALRQVFIAETLSIVVMEMTEVLIQVYTPGVMDAGLNSWIFWIGMALALTAGYIVAFPVNYILVGRGIRHAH